MTPFIGGKSDGWMVPGRSQVTLKTSHGEQYILIQFNDESKRSHWLYMLVGMEPLEAIKRYRVLNGFDDIPAQLAARALRLREGK